MGAQHTICVLFDAISQAQYGCCRDNIVVWMDANIIATNTDSLKLHCQRNNEMIWEWSGCPRCGGPAEQRIVQPVISKLLCWSVTVNHNGQNTQYWSIVLNQSHIMMRSIVGSSPWSWRQGQVDHDCPDWSIVLRYEARPIVLTVSLSGNGVIDSTATGRYDRRDLDSSDHYRKECLLGMEGQLRIIARPEVSRIIAHPEISKSLCPSVTVDDNFNWLEWSMSPANRRRSTVINQIHIMMWSIVAAGI